MTKDTNKCCEECWRLIPEERSYAKCVNPACKCHPCEHTNKEWDWREEFREYFDKTLKPKKPTMKNLDRELLVDFITKVEQQAKAAERAVLREKIQGLKEYRHLDLPDSLIRKLDVLTLLDNHD